MLLLGTSLLSQFSKRTSTSMIALPPLSGLPLRSSRPSGDSEDPKVKARSNGEVDKYRKERGIQVIGHNCPKPVTSFEEAGFPNYLAAEVGHF